LSAVVCLVAVVCACDASLIGQSAALPAAKDIIAKYVAAIGGAAEYDKITSMRAKGLIEIAGQGLSGQVEVLSARPAKSLQRTEIAGIGTIETGFDGTNGWSMDPMSGPSLTKGQQLTELRDDAEFDGALHKSPHVKEMTTVERVDFDGKPAYRVKVVFASGNEQFEYFDVQSGLQRGSEGTRETPMGKVQVTQTIREYKTFGALMQPTLVIEKSMGFEQTLTVSSIEYNVLAANAFDPPPAIKALIK
jgi:hypothetical protein